MTKKKQVYGISQKRDKELVKMARKRVDAEELRLNLYTKTRTPKEKKLLQSLIKDSETTLHFNTSDEAERLHTHEMMFRCGKQSQVVVDLGIKCNELNAGQKMLSNSLISWVDKKLKLFKEKLTDDEMKLFALLITYKDKLTKKNEPKLLTYREIAKVLNISKTTAERRASKFRKEHPDFASWINTNIQKRK